MTLCNPFLIWRIIEVEAWAKPKFWVFHLWQMRRPSPNTQRKSSHIFLLTTATVNYSFTDFLELQVFAGTTCKLILMCSQLHINCVIDKWKLVLKYLCLWNKCKNKLKNRYAQQNFGRLRKRVILWAQKTGPDDSYTHHCSIFDRWICKTRNCN